MKQRNNSIDIVRFLFAIYIVLGHTHIFSDCNETLYMIVSQLVVRCTVPFFFGVTGYYYISALLQGKANLVKSLKNILKEYVIWSAVYYVLSFVTNILLGNESLGTFLLERVRFFFIDGSFYHMWYVVALVYALIIITFVHKVAGEKGIFVVSICGIVMLVICAMGSVYYPIGSQIPMLKHFYDSLCYDIIRQWFGMAVPYITMGYFVIRMNTKEKVYTFRKVWIGFWISAMIFATEIVFIMCEMKYFERRELMLTTYLLVLWLLLLLLKNPLPRYEKQASIGRSLSNFVYFCHPLVIICLEKGLEIVGISMNTVLFSVAVIGLTCVAGCFILIIKKRLIKERHYG